MRLLPAIAAFCLFLAGSRAGLLPPGEPYQEAGGRVAGEAEHYHALTTGSGDSWTEATGPFQGARGGLFLQALPDGGSPASFSGPSMGAAVDYFIAIQTPGTYQLYLRWDGLDPGSDSIFAGILELADGAGGVPDWYEDTGHATTNFLTFGWDGLGGAEESQADASQNPMTWTISSPGTYTLRIVAREDAVALDAWVLQLASYNDLLFPGPDAVTMHLQSEVALPVLANDEGDLDTNTLTIVTPPVSGLATARQDGTIHYVHTSGAPVSDTLAYTVENTSAQTSAPTDVTFTFSSDLRLPNRTVRMPLEPPATTYEVVNAFPGIAFDRPTSMESPPDGSNSLVVTERDGEVFIIPDVAAAPPVKLLFLDIRDRVHDDGNELALKGVAFHPGYATNGTFYLAYNHLDSNGVRRVRLSRFLATGPVSADASSELLLIDQRNEGLTHNIADPQFGPDGYLYLGIGDEGFGNGPSNSQTIDSNIWSAILRIDPDKRPGNPEPNPHPGVPTNAAGQAYYSIPADNAFIGATQYNAVAVNTNNVRTEFFAVGFRNPWQFSFDPLTGDLWAGDVGLSSWEEINLVTNGGNYGWIFFEGLPPGPRPDITPPPGYTYDEPVWAYPHGDGAFEGRSVTGGRMLRGSRYPELDGMYLCSDLVSGNIWSLQRTSSATNVVRLAGEGGLVQFGLDPSNDDLLMIDYDEGVIKRLTLGTTGTPFPGKLSQTGFFADLQDLSPNPGVVAYEVNVPFWSDYAIKRRWFTITNLNDEVVFQPEGPWSYPTGMMWVKHFDLERTRGDTSTVVRVETRVLARNTNGAFGVSYRWNSNGTDAALVGDAGLEFGIPVADGGTTYTQTWVIPSRAQCLVCHTPAAGHALSFNTRQLNRDGAIAATGGNFLQLLEDAGYVANDVGEPGTLPRHLRPDETLYSLEARARTYLDVNCAYCHKTGSSSAPGTWDGRAELILADTGVLLGPASQNGGNSNNLLVVPGDTLHSIIYNRVAVSNGFTRMPPLASTEIDHTGVQLLNDWIGELVGRRTYAQWRLQHFGSTNSPDGEPDADPDQDGQDNDHEFLTYTEPTNALSVWIGSISQGGDDVTVSHDLPNRRVTVEMSTNLQDWSVWQVSGNQGLPLAPGEVQGVTGPANAAEGFWRFQIREN